MGACGVELPEGDIACHGQDLAVAGPTLAAVLVSCAGRLHHFGRARLGVIEHCISGPVHQAIAPGGHLTLGLGNSDR
eukprot:scaffold2162_cov398-Prasinococcus_capsulatus_cf.AAC.13